MAREAITVIGTVVGAFYGNPQLGYAIGAMVGGLVDPEQIKAPSIGDVAAQTSAEGVPCPLLAGTAGCAGNLIYCSPPRVVKGEFQSGKGGPEVQDPDRVYRTFAIRIGASLFDGPGRRNGITGVRKIWEDEKLVYDVSPESVILAESAAFAQQFTFYPGNETHLPDPDIEAIEGVGNVPSYRGRCYIVFKNKDVTDRRGSVSQYRFEVAVDAEEFANVSLVTDTIHYSGSKSELAGGASMGFGASIDVVRVSPDGIYAAGADRGSTLSGRFTLRKYDQATDSWSVLPDPAYLPTHGPRAIAWSPDSLTLAILSEDTSPEQLVLYRRSGDTFTKLATPAEPIPNTGGHGLAWDSVGQRLAVCNSSSAAGVFVYDFVADALINRRGASTGGVGGAPNRVDFMPGAGSRYLACGNTTTIYVVRCEESPMEIAVGQFSATALGAYWDSSSGYLIGVDNVTVSVYEFQSSVIGAESLTLLSTSPDALPANAQGASMHNGRRFLAVATGEQYPSIYTWPDTLPPSPVALTNPPASGAAIVSVSWTDSPDVPQIEAGTTTFEQLVLAAGRRCLIDDSEWEIPGLDAKGVKGSVVASQNYTAQDYINSLRLVFPSDGACFDQKIHLQLRGGAIERDLDEQYMVDEQDDAEQEEALRNGDEKRLAPIRRPLKINLMFPNAKVGYQLTKATSPNYGDRGDAVSETTLEIPIVLDEETEAPQLADILDKISRADAEGEIVRIFPESLAADLVPGSMVRLLGDDGLSRRCRVENKRVGDCTVRLLMRVDRAHAYTSQLTSQPGPVWPTPPPSLPGVTQFAVLNIPGIVDGDDVLGAGIRVAVRGLPDTAWSGCRVDYSTDSGANWTSLATITRAARMGTLLAPITAASPHYTDRTNVLSLLMIGDEELESLTQAQFLSEGNGAAICNLDGTAELIQFRDVVDEGDMEWTATRLLRGRLNTDASAHVAGTQFVMLDGTTFLPLPASLMGSAIRLRFTSSGTSAEIAPTYDFVWSPVNSQTEFSPANLFLERTGDTISASAVPRHRFGTDNNPIASANWTGYRWTATDGSNTATQDTATTAPAATFDVTGWASPVTVTVAMTNRFTGAGPAISEDIA